MAKKKVSKKKATKKAVKKVDKVEETKTFLRCKREFKSKQAAEFNKRFA
jgi:hypothetical protein